MLYNKDYLFIHIPRSGGKCIKSSVIPFLEKPIYFAQKYINKNYFNENDYIIINGNLVHSSLDEIEFLKKIKSPQEIQNERLSKMFAENQHLPDLKQTKNIVICLRNPLDRAKSLYKYQLFIKNYREDFETFTDLLIQENKFKFFCDTKNYCTINNELPDNIKFIRFDSLEQDLCKLLNVNKIDVQSKKHNEIHKLKEPEKQIFFKVKDVNRVVSNINTWEEWAIQNGLLNPITEKDLFI
jgi:hypothetical protein